MIPEAQLFTGKDLIFPIEQDNGNVRHCLARFQRRTMVDLSLRPLHHPATFARYTHNNS